MVLVIDPAGEEVQMLAQATQWRGKHVLEVGCGDGRLTLRLARLGPARIEALDPDPKLISAARQRLPKRYAGRVAYQSGDALQVGHPANAFDVVLLSWSL